MKAVSVFSKIALFTLLLPGMFRLEAQESTYRPVPVSISHTLDTVAGKVYFVHTVQRGHTLYSICRAYQTTAEALLKDSPESQVQADEFVYIPFNPALWNSKAQAERFTGKRPLCVLALLPPADVNGNDAGYTAATRTADTIADVPTTTAIPDNEPEITDKEDKAQARRSRREAREAAKAEAHADRLDDEESNLEANEEQIQINDSLYHLELQEKPHKDTLRISLLLPLYSNTPQDPKAYVYLPFFEGASVAWQQMLDPEFFIPAPTDTATVLLDSLLTDSISTPIVQPVPPIQPDILPDTSCKDTTRRPVLQLKLFDLTQSVESIDETIADEYFLQSDAVIATAFVDHFNRLDSVSQQAGLPLIHPVSERDSMGVGNPYLIRLAASYTTQLSQLAEFVQRKYPKARILIISDSSQSEVDKADRLSELIYQSERLYFNTTTAGLLEELAEESKRPVVILPFYRKEISAVKTVLPLRQNKGNFTIIAPAVWLDYSTIDLDYFIQNHLTVYNTFYGIHQNPDFLDFSKKYYFLYRGLPNTLAYQGYCVMRWLIDMLQTFNADFMRHIESEEATQNAQPFYRLEQRSVGGFENRNIQFIKIEPDGIERLEFTPFTRPADSKSKTDEENEGDL